jgi:dGTPase
MNCTLLRELREKWELENLSELATKSNSFAANRWLAEEECQYRTSFQRDVGRILYTNAFRRLRTKTQVFTDPDSQHNRTRLTHSLEVSQLSKQISRALYLNEDLTEAIALGHDLGHTPFGHAGERALNDMMEKSGGFSHNAQSVWIVENCFHGKKIGSESIPGLNLTYAVREGILKHTDITTNIEDYKRFRLDQPASLEGQVVDICDGLAYIYHDIQDGIMNKLISYDEVYETWKQATGIDNHSWFSTLINDVIENSFNKPIIDFSEPMKKAYKAVKKLVKEKIIFSSIIKEADNRGYEQVCEMFNLLSKNESLIPKTTENEYKKNKFGIERVIIDYIQWLGDQNFERILISYKERV